MFAKLKLFVLAAAAGGSALALGSTSEAAPERATAVFALGCFWSAEANLEKVPGVLNVVSGFSGGHVANPSYEQVVAGGTGHLEAVRVTYDPARVQYRELVRRAMMTADVTDGGGQFCDRGASYRTAVFASTPAEAQAARAVLGQLKQRYELDEIATKVLPARPFYPAEAYHQDFAKKNPARYTAYRIGCRRDARLREVYAAR